MPSREIPAQIPTLCEDPSGAQTELETVPLALPSHDSFPRDPTMSMSQRSHRVPFYMDSLNFNSSR